MFTQRNQRLFSESSAEFLKTCFLLEFTGPLVTSSACIFPVAPRMRRKEVRWWVYNGSAHTGGYRTTREEALYSLWQVN